MIIGVSNIAHTFLERFGDHLLFFLGGILLVAPAFFVVWICVKEEEMQKQKRAKAKADDATTAAPSDKNNITL